MRQITQEEFDAPPVVDGRSTILTEYAAMADMFEARWKRTLAMEVTR